MAMEKGQWALDPMRKIYSPKGLEVKGSRRL